MNILFICTANVCRSPVAHGYLQLLVERNRIPDVSVSSAGVFALAGSHAFDCSKEVALQNGFDLSLHRARQLTLDMAGNADLILCMETGHVQRVLDLSPDLLSKTGLLGKYHPANQPLFQIRDPRRFSTDEMLLTFADIKKAVDSFVTKFA